MAVVGVGNWESGVRGQGSGMHGTGIRGGGIGIMNADLRSGFGVTPPPLPKLKYLHKRELYFLSICEIFGHFNILVVHLEVIRFYRLYRVASQRFTTRSQSTHDLEVVVLS